MFLNQAQPRSLVSNIKDYLSDGIATLSAFSSQTQTSTTAVPNTYAAEAYAKRANEIEHKQALIGSGMSDWR